MYALEDSYIKRYIEKKYRICMYMGNYTIKRRQKCTIHRLIRDADFFLVGLYRFFSRISINSTSPSPFSFIRITSMYGH